MIFMDKYTVEEMKEQLMRVYPSGVINSQFILQMSDRQIRAIYKWHEDKHIPMDRPREAKQKKQLAGQMSMF